MLTIEKIAVLVPRSMMSIFCIPKRLLNFYVLSICVFLAQAFAGKIAIKSSNIDGASYVKLSPFLEPAGVKVVYNRALHKLSFSYNDTFIVLYPLSDGVAINGKVEFFNKPLIINKGVAYISKPLAVFLAPKLSYELIKRLIVIDPGHGGGGDDGLGAKAILDGKEQFEKELTLRFSKMLGAELEKNGYVVKYTRINDVKIPLDKRASLANSEGAKTFISIHANSSSDTDARGTDVFFMSEEAEDSYSATVAKQENLLLGGKRAEKNVEDILKSMMVSGHIKESSNLAYEISSKLSKITINRGVKKAPFAVLHSSYMPSVLIELGFMSNEKDLRNMNSDTWMSKLSQDVSVGIEAYFNKSKEELLNEKGQQD